MRLPFLNHKSKKGRIKNMKIQRDGKEYTLTAEEVMEAHEEFVTSFMVAELENSYDVPHKYSKDLAKEALHKKEKETMDIDTLIERQEVLVENQKQLLSAMVSTLDLMKAEKLRQEIDQEIAFDEPNKTVDQEEDPRVQEHKIIALKNGYTPEDVEEVASIYRSYYESLDEIEADLAAEGKPSNGSDYELRAENVRALRDQDLSYIDHKYEEQRKQKSRPTQHPLKRPKKTMSKI